MVFGLFQSSVPMFAREKAWAEVRMQWLWDRLGGERLLRSQMLLPDVALAACVNVDGEFDLQACFELVCHQMQVDPRRCEVRVGGFEEMGDHAGTWESAERQNVIRIRNDQLGKPLSVVSTLAHELSHEILLGGELLRQDELDQEDVTDLLPVFCGCGLFAANATVGEPRTHGAAGLSRQGYLNSGVLGYACALYAWARGETATRWKSFLRPDAAVTFKRGCRYLQRTGDSLFRPMESNHLLSASASALAVNLRDASPSASIGTLWALANLGDEARDVLGEIVPLLQHGHYEIRAAAARALGKIGGTNTATHRQLTRLVYDGHWQVRTAVALAIGRLAIDPDDAVATLSRLVVDDDSTVATAASLALVQFGADAGKADKDIFAALKKSVIRWDVDLASRLLAVLAMCQASVPDYLCRRFSFDEELRDQALHFFETEVSRFASEDWQSLTKYLLQVHCCPLG